MKEVKNRSRVMRNRKINILVTGVGGNIGQGVMKAIRMTCLKTRIVGTDINPLSSGLYRCDRGYVVKSCEDDGFFDQIVRIIRRERIDVVFVGSDTELAFFSENRRKIESLTNSFVLVSDSVISQFGYDKWKTYQFCCDRQVPYPRTFLPRQKREIFRLVREKGFPVMVKPRVGYGSRNVHRIQSWKELEFFSHRVSQGVIQEHLGSVDEEYTAASFVTEEKRIVGTIIFKRYLSSGATYKAEVIEDAAMRKAVESIILKISPLGPCNVQFRKVRGKVIPFEFNIRFSGTTPMRSQLGFNDVEMALRHFVLRQPLRKPKVKRGVVFRYWNEVVLPNQTFRKIQSKKIIHKSRSLVLDSF